MKKCICCGMPLTKKEDYALQDESKDYCLYCMRDDGSMKSYEEAVEGYSEYLRQTLNLNEEDARKKAIEELRKNPAWSDR